MLGRANISRSFVFCLGLSVCTAAWLAVMADGPSPQQPSKIDKPLAPNAPPAGENEKPLRPPGDRDVDSPVPALPTTEEAVINEILQIRREQGGLLDGTLLEELSGQAAQGTGQSSPGQDAEFARALRGVAAAAAADSRPTLPPPVSPMIATPNQSLVDSEDRSNAVGDASLIELMRLTARRLDSQAADLEDVDEYRQAKRCRAAATKLRRLARDLKECPVD